MSLNEDEKDKPVNVLDFFREHGLDDRVAFQLVLHMLLTRSYAYQDEAREVALELGVDIPFVFPGNGVTH